MCVKKAISIQKNPPDPQTHAFASIFKEVNVFVCQTRAIEADIFLKKVFKLPVFDIPNFGKIAFFTSK